MKRREKKVNITLDEDVIEKLKTLAMNNGRSLSGYMNVVIREYVSEKKEDRPSGPVL